MMAWVMVSKCMLGLEPAFLVESCCSRHDAPSATFRVTEILPNIGTKLGGAANRLNRLRWASWLFYLDYQEGVQSVLGLLSGSYDVRQVPFRLRPVQLLVFAAAN